MDTSGFIITNISFYNYGGKGKKLNGSITLQHEGRQNEMKLMLNEADCSKIVNVIADRVAETIHEAARQFWVDVGMPMREFMPSSEPIGAAITSTAEVADALGLNKDDPAFGGQKED